MGRAVDRKERELTGFPSVSPWLPPLSMGSPMPWSWTFCLEPYRFAQIALDPCLRGAFTSPALTTRLLGQLPIGHFHLRVVLLGTRWQTDSEIGILVREIF